MPDTLLSQRNDAVIDLARSPFAKLKPVPLSAVQITDSFWSPRIKANREITLPSQLAHLEATGRLDNFRRASGKKPELPFQGFYFNDSDVYKWLEAASYSLAAFPDSKFEAQVDAVIQEVADAQQPDGYLNTYFMFEKEKERFSNLKDMHELYCAGHLIQAAVAHYRATGKRTLLDVGSKLADHLGSVFGEAEGKRFGTCGHEELEMALVELFRTTNEPHYLTLAKFMIDVRGRKPGIFGNSPYHQEHLPFTEQTEMVGHAVRHLYLCCGAADVALETGDQAYLAALEALWQNFTERRMYITGGAGARYEGESFGEDYELPNDRAYTETCAAIGSVMWNWRMLNLTGDAKYADLMERTLYNAVLPGLSLDGKHYFYENPLADRGKHRRQEWFGCACCPPNIARMLASLSSYFCSTSAQGAYLHLYATGAITIPFENGEVLRLNVKTDYPWQGTVDIEVVEAPKQAKFLYLRIPEWTEGATVQVNGCNLGEAAVPGSYYELALPYAGDVITVELPMPIRVLESNPMVAGNLGRVALMRGALVYCLEQSDHGTTDVWEMYLPENGEFTSSEQSDLLNGVMVLEGEALALQSDQNAPLYAPHGTKTHRDFKPTELFAIPYYAWANREPGAMQVWIPLAPEK